MPKPPYTTRRRLLQAGLALAASAALPRAFAVETSAQRDGRLLVVFLRGGLDGLFRNTDPQQPFVPATGKAMDSGMLEASNVDAAGALVQMIQLQRQYEMQVKVIKNGDENARAANSLLRLNG